MPEEPGAGWNFISLKAYLDARYTFNKELRDEIDKRYQERFEASQKAIHDALNSAERAVAAALASAEQAVLKAEIANNKRFESVNEFRGTLTDQTARMMTRAEADAKNEALSDRLLDLKSRIDAGEGGAKASSNNFTSLIAIAGLIVSVVVAIFAGVSLIDRSSPIQVAQPATSAK